MNRNATLISTFLLAQAHAFQLKETSASLLAQLTQSDTQHTCSTAMERVKDKDVDFDEINGGSRQWTDENFPTNDAFYWKDANEDQGSAAWAYENDGIGWKRITDDDFGIDSFWGPNGKDSINPQDIVQGSIGNCWIMAAVSALAEVKGRIDSVILNDDFSQAGIYGVNMYALGVPFTEYVDDYLPVVGSMPVFQQKGKDESIWGAVVEKAFAKRYGNYHRTEGGWMATGVASLNGSPFETHLHDSTTKDELWQLLSDHRADTDIITAGTACYGADQNCYTAANLPGNHAYTILGICTVQKSGQEVKLIKVRNPWGEEEYNGPWSDQSGEWTPELRAEVEEKLGNAAEPNNEGIYFMDLDTYHSNFNETQVNQDTSSWDLSHFLMFNDRKSPSANEEDCSNCTQHIIEITNSGAAQDVHVGAHVWQDRTYGWYHDDCAEAIEISSSKHQIKCLDSGATAKFDSEYGSGWLPVISFEANETKRFAVTFDWNRQNIVKDWSATAWGTDHEVTVAHEDGISSRSLPYYGQPSNGGDDEENDEQDGGDEENDQEEGDEGQDEDGDEGEDGDEDEQDDEGEEADDEDEQEDDEDEYGGDEDWDYDDEDEYGGDEDWDYDDEDEGQDEDWDYDDEDYGQDDEEWSYDDEEIDYDDEDYGDDGDDEDNWWDESDYGQDDGQDDDEENDDEYGDDEGDNWWDEDDYGDYGDDEENWWEEDDNSQNDDEENWWDEDDYGQDDGEEQDEDEYGEGDNWWEEDEYGDDEGDNWWDEDDYGQNDEEENWWEDEYGDYGQDDEEQDYGEDTTDNWWY